MLECHLHYLHALTEGGQCTEPASDRFDRRQWFGPTGTANDQLNFDPEWATSHRYPHQRK